MPYRAPNTYARFVKTAGAVNSPGAARVMGLIGTGLNYYEVYNEPVQKKLDRPYETLVNPNVFEIISVSTKPYISGKDTTDNKFYLENTDYVVKEGQYLAWETVKPAESQLIMPTSVGGQAFYTKINLADDAANAYLAVDGNYIIEVTYVDPVAGTYRVINDDTKEIMGEYAVSDATNNVIPGFALSITSTYKEQEVTDPIDGTVETKNVINVGDYVRVTTTAGLTVEPSTVNKLDVLTDTSDINHTYSDVLATLITGLKINSIDNLETGNYLIYVDNKEANTFKVMQVGGVDVSIGGQVFVGIAGINETYPEVIPGVTFTVANLNIDTINNNDAVEIEIVKNINENVPEEGSLYYVSYKYKKADEDYGPKIYFDYDDVVAEYGNYDVTVSGIIVNSLSLGAEIAFVNGTQPIVCVQAKNESDYEMNVAIDKLQRTLPGVTNINTIVPLTESISVGAYAMNHAIMMSDPDNSKERMVYLGASRNQPITKVASVLDRSLGMVETAKAFNNERVVFVVPGEITKDIRDLRTGKTSERKLPACYAAIAVAALGLRNDPAEPLTNKTITGFKNLTTMYMESEKNFLAAAGCLVLDQNGPVIKVRHGITTSIADVDSSEITLVQIKDYVIEACRTSTASLYIGNKNRPSVVSDVQYTISNMLGQFVSQEVILGYSGLSVKRSKDDPRQIDVKFEIEAVYPLNYINITFGFSANS